jgi:shikimate dehydrogenase
VDESGTVSVGVIGDPIAHSLSPTLHNAAFAALGLDWHSTAILVREDQAAEVLPFMREHSMAGLSVTMPLKASLASLVDSCSETARRLNAVNCLINRDGAISGENTDGKGFVESLQRGAAFIPAGRRCVVLGAGGAARAVILALAEAGAGEVAVINRTLARAVDAAALAGAAGRVVADDDPGEVERAVAQSDLIVNATPVGMGNPAGSDAEWPADPSLLHEGQVAADLLYFPRPTPWLVAAVHAGAVAVDGLGMLVHQAAAQIELWTGQPAPVEAMWSAVV